MKHEKSLHWIGRIAKKQALLLCLLSVCSIVSSVSYIGLALVSRRVINIAVTAASVNDVKDDIIKCGLLLLSVIIGQLLLTVLNSHLKAVISGKIEMSLRHRLFDKVMSKEYPAISKIHSGELLNRFTSDTDIVVSGITNFIPNALSIIAKLLSGLIVITSFSKGYTAIVISTGIFVLFCAILISPIFKRLHKEVQQASGIMRSFSQECMENIVVVKSFSGNKPLLEKLDEHMRKIYNKKIFRNHISNIAGGGISFIFTSLYYATLLWGTIEIAAGSMDYGTLMAFLQIVSQIRTPFFNASGIITQFYSALASAERIMEIEELPDEPVNSDLNVNELYEKMTAVKLNGLSFSYSNKTVIEDSSARIPKGSIVSLTGPSGVGKSTLFRLLLGLFSPNSGSLSIETDTSDINITPKLRSMFSYVPQGNFVLSGTIAENIRFSNPHAFDEDMISAAKSACVYDFIKSLPDGFDTMLGERGLGLSEGQIQRIAIARALVSDAPILLLDECTSALDEETERRLLDNIAEMKTKTVFFISHRSTALSICNTHLHFNGKKIYLTDNVPDLCV